MRYSSWGFLGLLLTSALIHTAKASDYTYALQQTGDDEKNTREQNNDRYMKRVLGRYHRKPDPAPSPNPPPNPTPSKRYYVYNKPNPKPKVSVFCIWRVE